MIFFALALLTSSTASICNEAIKQAKVRIIRNFMLIVQLSSLPTIIFDLTEERYLDLTEFH